jgi:iron complex outermembrane recepter protein
LLPRNLDLGKPKIFDEEETMILRVVGVVLVMAWTAGDPVAPANEVVGRVVDEHGQPLGQVEIVNVTGIGAAMTGADGRFRLRNMPEGRHRLQLTRLGYAPVVREIEVAEAGGVIELEVVMLATPLSLAGVQVTGTPSARESLYGTQATSQLHGRALERTLSGSIATTLSNEPGVGVRYNGPGATAPIVRGLTGDRVLVLQDGQRSGDLSGSADDHGMAVDPLSAQRIEVVRGPAALLYGNNALGGVVNVITGEPPTQIPTHAEWRVSLQGESAFPGAAGMVRGTIPLADRWAVSIRGNVREAGDARVGREGGQARRLANTDRRTLEGSAGIGYLDGRMSAGANLRTHSFEYGLPLPPGEEAEVRLDGRMVAGAGQGQLALRSRLFPTARASVTYQDYWHEELEYGQVEMAFGLRTGTAELLVNQGRIGPVSEGAWGISWLGKEYVATGAEQLTAPAGSSAIGFFGFQELAPEGSALTLQFGGRFDHYSIDSRDDPRFGPGIARTFPALSGSAGANFRVGEAATLAVSTSRAFRAPTVEELFSDALHVGVAAYEIGDPELSAERATGLDAIVRAQRPGLNVEFAAHRNRIDDFVHIEERGDTLIDGTVWSIVGYVQADAILVGFEARAEYVLARRMVGEVTGDFVRGSLTDGEPLPFMPAPRVGGSLRWDDGRWAVGVSLRHSFRQARVGLEDEVPTAAFTLLGTDLGTRFVHSDRIYSIGFRVDNLADVGYRDAASRIKAFAPGPGRNAALLLRAYF